MRRLLLGVTSLLALVTAAAMVPACGSDDDTNAGAKDGGPGTCTGFACPEDGGPSPTCIGLECQQLPCEGGAKTTISGTVFDPAGKVPVYNVTVYVPNAPLDPITEGASCNRCDASVSGKPLVITATDTSGHFTLENVPVGADIPLVVQIGKWRREITIPNVTKCADTALDAGVIRLPRNRTEGDIPRIAISTGAADPLQCLLRKIGIDDSEFGVAGSEARIHLYQGGGFDDGTAHVASGSIAGGATFGASTALTASKDELKKYDVVLLSCEGTDDDDATRKPTAAKQALYDYAKEGGRVFASHYHHGWFSSSPDASVVATASWAIPEKQPPAQGNPATTAVPSDISTAFPKAVAMKDWLEKQNALEAGKLPLYDARHNVNAVGTTALDWISAVNPNDSGSKAVQYMTFNTPVGAPEDQLCGRVVYSTLHLAAGQQGGVSDSAEEAFPTGCKTTDLTAQQKALEFMLFDLSSCVQKDNGAVVPPK